MITVSVPGKIRLMGEHSVVYGYPALLSAINLRMRVSIGESPKGSSGIRVVSTESTRYADHAVHVLLEKLHIEDPLPSTITIDSDIPSGFHLGSSAAVAVGITGAMMFVYKKIWNPIRINELAYEIEKKQHGSPSGGDNTVVTMGGFIWFRKELEFLKSIWQLPFKPHESLNHFMLIDTGKPQESTGDMIKIVKEKIAQDPELMHRLFFDNEQQVKRITTALKEGNEQELCSAIQTGEHTLERMGVVSDQVISCIRAVEKEGGVVKILGGGGKTHGVGYMLCYQHDASRIASIVSPFHFSVQPITLGEEGIRLDEK